MTYCSQEKVCLQKASTEWLRATFISERIKVELHVDSNLINTTETV